MERKAAHLQQRKFASRTMRFYTLRAGRVRPSSCSMVLPPTKTIGPVSPNGSPRPTMWWHWICPVSGESSCLECASYSIADQAKRLNLFADAIGLKTFHIVGNSMGGHIAGRYTVMFPERIRTLGLFNSAGVRSPVPSEMFTRLSRGEPNPWWLDPWTSMTG